MNTRYVGEATQRDIGQKQAMQILDVGNQRKGDTVYNGEPYWVMEYLKQITRLTQLYYLCINIY